VPHWEESTVKSDSSVPRIEPERRTSSHTVLWQRFTLALLTTATRPVQKMSPLAAHRFGTTLGRFAYNVAKRPRTIAVRNLRLAYGDTLTVSERNSLVCRTFEHYGRGVVTFLRAETYTKEELAALTVCRGWEHIEQGFLAGRGVIFVSAHLGNWEMLGRWGATVKDLPLTAIAKDPKNPALAQYLRMRREEAGFGVLSRGESARAVIQLLNRGEVVCLLADQNSGDLFAPFFGVPAGTVAGPAAFAQHTGAALLPIFCLAQPDGTYEIECFPPLSLESSGERKADQQRLMTEFNRILEGVVRRYPDQWLWLHNRWKSTFETDNIPRAWGDIAGCQDVQTAYYSAYERWKA